MKNIFLRLLFKFFKSKLPERSDELNDLELWVDIDNKVYYDFDLKTKEFCIGIKIIF